MRVDCPKNFGEIAGTVGDGVREGTAGVVQAAVVIEAMPERFAVAIARAFLGVRAGERASAVGFSVVTGVVTTGVFASADATVGGILALLRLVGKYLGVLAAALAVGIRGGVAVHGGGRLFGARGFRSKRSFNLGCGGIFGSACGVRAHGLYATVRTSPTLANPHLKGRSNHIR